MQSTHLTKGHCVPCEGGTVPFAQEEVAKYLTLLKTPWNVSHEGKQLEKTFKHKDFRKAIQFVNTVADLAEGEGHHPDILVTYDKVKISLTTHAIGGLSTNDFILAAKIEIL